MRHVSQRTSHRHTPGDRPGREEQHGLVGVVTRAQQHVVHGRAHEAGVVQACEVALAEYGAMLLQRETHVYRDTQHAPTDGSSRTWLVVLVVLREPAKAPARCKGLLSLLHAYYELSAYPIPPVPAAAPDWPHQTSAQAS